MKSWRNSDGSRFYLWNDGSGEFLFHASGRHPNDRSSLTSVGRVNCDEAALPCVEPQFVRLDVHKVGCDAAARFSNASYHLVVVASDVLFHSELSEQSSLMMHGRFFPTLFGRASNHHSSDSPDMLEQNWTSYLVWALVGACACPFLRGAFLTGGCACGQKQSRRSLRRNSDGSHFYIWNESYNAILFGPSDSRLNVWER